MNCIANIYIFLKCFHFLFQLFFKTRGVLNEEGFVLFVRKNAIIVLIPKFGLEGTVFFDTKEKTGPNLVFDEEVFTFLVSLFYYRNDFFQELKYGTNVPNVHV